MSYSIDLSRQVALVTGGGDGIGFAIAKILTQAGAQVVVNDMISETEGNRRVAKLEEYGLRPVYILCDISDKAGVEQMMETVRTKFGRLDMLINNAGVNSDFDKSFAVNAKGCYYCTMAAMPMLCQTKGRVVMISSASVFSGGTGYYAYNTTKAGTYALAMMFARNYAKEGVRVNCVAPAVVMSHMMIERFGSEEAVLDHYQNIMPLGRIGYPEDIAGVVLFLVSSLSHQITGELLTVDGGRMKIG